MEAGWKEALFAGSATATHERVAPPGRLGQTAPKDGTLRMDGINVGIIGTGWCGGIRAETCADRPQIAELHIAETRPERLAKFARPTSPKIATEDCRVLIEDHGIEVTYLV